MRLPSLALLASAAAAQPQGDGFADLFNGKDLTGWVNVNCAPETWRVVDGVLACDGKPTGALRTERMYENFELELEWRHLQSGGNAGIFVWAGPLPAKGVPFLRAIEVQVLDHGYGNTEEHTTHGDVFPIWGSTMVPIGKHRGMRSFPSDHRSLPAPQWNHYRIVARDGELRLAVNGKEVSGGKKCNWRKGYLGLESEGAPTEWRKVRIKELPGGGAKPEETADAALGHRPLYSGVDLRGWQTEGGAQEVFAAEDWRLVMRREGPADAALVSVETFTDFELVADIKLGKDPAAQPRGGIRFASMGHDRVVFPLHESGGLAAGAWHRLVLRRQGGAFAIEVDGKARPAPEPGEGDGKEPGRIVLAHTGRAVELCNLYVRELAGGK